MHLFTIIQFSGLGLLWGVKESPAALAFPFFVVSMIALRWSLKFIFTEKELDHVRRYQTREIGGPMPSVEDVETTIPNFGEHEKTDPSPLGTQYSLEKTFAELNV